MAPFRALGGARCEVDLERGAGEHHGAHVAPIGDQAGRATERQLQAVQRAAHLGQGRDPRRGQPDRLVAQPDLEWLRRLEHISTEIDRVWGPVYHLNSVVSSPALREAFNRCLPLVTEFGTELAQNETLYRHFSTLQANVGPTKPVERQLIDNAIKGLLGLGCSRRHGGYHL